MTSVPQAKELEKLLNKGMKAAIISHFNPDGDAVGSSAALRSFLSDRGIHATTVTPSPVPEFLDFLDPAKETVCYTEDKERARRAITDADVIFCLDFNKLDRTEWLADTIAGAKAFKVLIDHHPGPDTGQFGLIISDPAASSTCELLYRTLLSLASVESDPSRLGHCTLTALATGIITDTNNFSNSVTPDTFTAASDMLRLGVSLDSINNTVFKRYSESRMRLMGHLLADSMTLHPGLNASTMIITMEDRERYGFADGDSEGFVNLPLMIRNVEVSALFSETRDYIRVSLRSKGGVAVNALARSFFNGGGHDRAAGGRLFMPIGEVRDYFLQSLEQFLQSNSRTTEPETGK